MGFNRFYGHSYKLANRQFKPIVAGLTNFNSVSVSHVPTLATQSGMDIS